jgi:hypothetical protein
MEQRVRKSVPTINKIYGLARCRKTHETPIHRRTQHDKIRLEYRRGLGYQFVTAWQKKMESLPAFSPLG